MHNQEDNSKMDFKGTGCWDIDLSDAEYGPVVGSCKHGDEHLGSIKCRKFLG
jgi:hypothetical protein